MREILFRGKHINGDGEWIYGFYFQKPDPFTKDGKPVAHCISDLPPFGKEIVISTLGQYTGLTDKNGTKIFEGDVLRFYSDYTNEFMGEPCIARYGEFNCTCCEGVYGWYFEGGDIRNHNLYVVLGNIHDNPELMR